MSKNFLALVIICCLWQQSKAQCDLSGKEKFKQIAFPDYFKETQDAFIMTVEYTSLRLNQSDYVKEYYDVKNKRGRVDSHSDGKSSTYYYYAKTNEAFEVSGDTCESLALNMTVPKFMKHDPTDWVFTYPGESTIRGPSAMFRYALMTWKNANQNMAYLGEAEAVRGIKSRKWRRCANGLTYDYFVTLQTRDDEFEVSALIDVPLRVVVSKPKDESGLYPQTYEILILQPYISANSSVFQIPTGKGCKRGDSVYKPPMKKYLDSTIFTMVEAVCLNCDGKKLGDGSGIWNYYSTFTYAVDQQSGLFVYMYTPWGKVVNGTQKQGSYYRHIIYDGKNEYLYNHDLYADDCIITRQPSFAPRYFFPKGGGYIDLTDEFILYPDKEYDYIDDGTYKGMPVHIYEAVQDGYTLGNRSVATAIFTRYYFKDNVTDNENVVPGALTAIAMKFYPNKDSRDNVIQLTLNFYGFSTQIPYRRNIFNVADCFKNPEDSAWVTLSFPAAPATIDKLQNEGPNIELEVFSSLLKNSELNAMRIPTMLLDMSNAVYIQIQVLEKPPIELDFTGEEKGVTISGTQRTEPISDLNSCGKICTESETSCWGIAICGSLCYLGVDDKAKTAADPKCTFYRRYKNRNVIFSKDMMITNIRREVEEHRVAIVVPGLGEGGQPIQLEANYIDVSDSSGRNDGINILGRKTDPRLRKYKGGSKLIQTGEEIKNVGKVGYEQCQKLCLDYKQCETLSYCETGATPQCILTTTSADKLDKTKIAEDNYCTILTRKYTDHFVNTPGTQLTRSYQKSYKAASNEECAKLCMDENSFTCFSFDYCPWDTATTCLLHNVHFLDSKDKEPMKANASCGHYYKKYSYDFTRKPQLRSVGSNLVSTSKLDLETCAKNCVNLKNGTCLGYDFCQDKTYTSTSCTLLVDAVIVKNTTHSDLCDHYTKIIMKESTGGFLAGTSVVWVGVLCFFIALAVGIAMTFGIAYIRMKRSS